MTTTEKVAIGAASVASIAAIAVGSTSTLIDPPSSTAIVSGPTYANCEDWNVLMTSRECFAAGTIRFVGLYNEQGAAQFCKWQPANPGEWTRITNYSTTGVPPASMKTWLGASIVNWLQAYFVTGAPPFTIQPNTSPNKCKTPLSSPEILGVTPSQNGATVTIGG